MSCLLPCSVLHCTAGSLHCLCMFRCGLCACMCVWVLRMNEWAWVFMITIVWLGCVAVSDWVFVCGLSLYVCVHGFVHAHKQCLSVCDCWDGVRQALTLVCFITESFCRFEAFALTATQTLTLMIYVLGWTALCFTETLYSLLEVSRYLMLQRVGFYIRHNSQMLVWHVR